MTLAEALEKLDPGDIADVFREFQQDAAIGKRWHANSSLEEWFPFSAKRLARLTEALKLVLLFHSGAQWDDDAIKEWTGGLDAIGHHPYDCTTKNLCDAVRAALKEGA